MSSSESSSKRLDRWMLEQYDRQGYAKNNFIGKEKFLNLLISEYGKHVGGVVPEDELREKVTLGAWPPHMQKPKQRPPIAYPPIRDIPLGSSVGNQNGPISLTQHAVVTARLMRANQNTQFDQIDASQHGIAENSEKLHRAQFSHGLPTPGNDRDESPVHEDEQFNLAPLDSVWTGRLRERVTNEWVASTVARPINPSAVSSLEIPSTKLPSSEVLSPGEAFDVGQVDDEMSSNECSAPAQRRILPLRTRRVTDQSSASTIPTPPHLRPSMNGPSPAANQRVEAEMHLNPRLEELRLFTQKPHAPAGSQVKSRRKSKQDEDDLLRWSSSEEEEDNDLIGGEETTKDEIQDAALFSHEILKSYDAAFQPQHALLGVNVMAKQMASKKNVKLYQNTNIPNSIFICGLQGTGKSHTLSCLIENCLIQAPMLGQLHKPLSALIFHFSQYTSRISFRPCEAAYLGCPNQSFPDHPCVAPVDVLVAPSNYHNLRQLYGQIPGVRVFPFKLRPQDLNVSSMLTLMSVDQTSTQPLYVGTITKILRDMASTSANDFDYRRFKQLLFDAKLTKMQLTPLEQRLELLESFFNLDDSAPGWDFRSGGATIIDLSCPFVDPNMACVLFNIGMSLYLESGLTTGKVIAMDEAHKYLTDTPASKALTESMLQVIRQQRHYGVRVIISTQEPTISPRLMDLCSSTVIHRFTSPDWFHVLRNHISMEGDGNPELFKRILDLRVGEALLFAPSTLLVSSGGTDGWGGNSVGMPTRLGAELLKIKVRRRVTWDGGKSILASGGEAGMGKS